MELHTLVSPAGRPKSAGRHGVGPPSVPLVGPVLSSPDFYCLSTNSLEQVVGIEPTSSAWEAEVMSIIRYLHLCKKGYCSTINHLRGPLTQALVYFTYIVYQIFQKKSNFGARGWDQTSDLRGMNPML